MRCALRVLDTGRILAENGRAKRLRAMVQNWNSTNLTSVDQVFAVLADLRGRLWLSRGQSRCFGSLFPTIDRGKLQALRRLEKLTLERQSIDLFRSTARYFSDPGEQSALSSDFIALMLLRHHAVPTRPLDWSLSPYVAAYFAACDTDSKDGEIWCFDEALYAHKGGQQWSAFPETTIDGSGDQTKVDLRFPTAFRVDEPSNWFVCHFYPVGFHRQSVQAGAFSFTPKFNRDHAQAIADLLKDEAHYHRYVVSAPLKADLRRLLREKHGIWRGSLFPDVAGAATTARSVFPDDI
jgi:hypothetical protein